MTDEQKTNSTVVDWNEEEHDVEVNNVDDEAEDIEVVIPDELPILPLRGVVVYPQTIIPLTVGQPRSIKLVDEVGQRQPHDRLDHLERPQPRNAGS